MAGGQSFRPEPRRFRAFTVMWGCVFAALLASLTACAPRAPAKEAQFIGGPFALTDQNGVKQTQSLLRGKWSLVFFGYTFCPDVCPVTLSNLGAALVEMGPEASRVRVVFITVDPERDTPRPIENLSVQRVLPAWNDRPDWNDRPGRQRRSRLPCLFPQSRKWSRIQRRSHIGRLSDESTRPIRPPRGRQLTARGGPTDPLGHARGLMRKPASPGMERWTWRATPFMVLG